MSITSRPENRIPVYLLTGYLGSGKTSLLRAWLTQPELAGAALVINELGEVGLDNQLLSAASESAALVANACVCCSGLPGLQEALEELFWARLQRRIDRFPHLVIETTGLAEPDPVVAALQSAALLRERYRLAGVITCLSAATADQVLTQHPEARAQLAGADLLVVTKTDLVSPEALARLLQRLNHQLAQAHPPATAAQRGAIQLRTSTHASLTAAQMQLSLGAVSPGLGQPLTPEMAQATNRTVLGQAHDHDHDHDHSARAYWWPIPDPVEGEQLLGRINSLQACLGTSLLRLKGQVLTEHGPWVVQMAPFETSPSVQVLSERLSGDQPTGLTVIVARPLSPSQQTRLGEILA